MKLKMKRKIILSSLIAIGMGVNLTIVEAKDCTEIYAAPHVYQVAPYVNTTRDGLYTSYDSCYGSNTEVWFSDMTHFCATLSALLFEYADGNQEALDTLSNIYAGWGGDVLSFTANIEKAQKDGEKDLLDWAKKKIGTSGTRFSRSDYCADIDAINISRKIKNGISLPIAFKTYFKPLFSSETPEALKRTGIWFPVMGNSYFDEICELLKQDETRIFANLLAKSDGVNSKYISIAIDAFKYYVNKEYVAGR